MQANTIDTRDIDLGDAPWATAKRVRDQAAKTKAAFDDQLNALQSKRRAIAVNYEEALGGDSGDRNIATIVKLEGEQSAIRSRISTIQGGETYLDACTRLEAAEARLAVIEKQGGLDK